VSLIFKGQFNVHFLDEIDTEQKAYILGFLQCDGSFSCRTKDGKSYYRYKLAIQEADKEILFKIKEYTENKGKIVVQKANRTDRQSLYELSFNSRYFVDRLRSLFGGYLKSERLLIPDIPDHLIHHYLRGVFDADGTFGDYNGLLLRFDGKRQFLEK
jgi:intein-encoded DNA endonuclease-like protein